MSDTAESAPLLNNELLQKDEKDSIKPNFTNPKDYYSILGLPKNASGYEIKENYKKLSIRYLFHLNHNDSFWCEMLYCSIFIFGILN